MIAGLQFTLSNPVPGKEDEYNEWYGEDHLGNGVLTPHVLAGQRFRRVAGPWPEGRHDYLVIWEFDDPEAALEALGQAKGTESMPISEAIDMAGIQPPTMWLRASVSNAARVPADPEGRRSCVLLLANAAEGAGEAFESTLTGGGLARLADLAGVARVDFLTLGESQIRGNARKYGHAVLLELADEAEGLRSLEPVLAGLEHMDCERWLAPVYRPLGRRVTRADMAPLASEARAAS